MSPIRFQAGTPRLVAGLRRHHATDDLHLAIAEQWREFHTLGLMAGRIGADMYGIICGGSTTEFEYMCGVEVQGFEGLPAGAGRLRIHAQQYAVFIHEGDRSALHSIWEEILQTWFPKSGYVSAHTPDFEVYGPRFDLHTGRGRIEIWISVAPIDSFRGIS
jgi:AraC family transcriptional regulator